VPRAPPTKICCQEWFPWIPLQDTDAHPMNSTMMLNKLTNRTVLPNCHLISKLPGQFVGELMSI